MKLEHNLPPEAKKERLTTIRREREELVDKLTTALAETDSAIEQARLKGSISHAHVAIDQMTDALVSLKNTPDLTVIDREMKRVVRLYTKGLLPEADFQKAQKEHESAHSARTIQTRYTESPDLMKRRQQYGQGLLDREDYQNFRRHASVATPDSSPIPEVPVLSQETTIEPSIPVAVVSQEQVIFQNTPTQSFEDRGFRGKQAAILNKLQELQASANNPVSAARLAEAVFGNSSSESKDRIFREIYNIRNKTKESSLVGDVKRSKSLPTGPHGYYLINPLSEKPKNATAQNEVKPQSTHHELSSTDHAHDEKASSAAETENKQQPTVSTEAPVTNPEPLTLNGEQKLFLDLILQNPNITTEQLKASMGGISPSLIASSLRALHSDLFSNLNPTHHNRYGKWTLSKEMIAALSTGITETTPKQEQKKPNKANHTSKQSPREQHAPILYGALVGAMYDGVELETSDLALLISPNDAYEHNDYRRVRRSLKVVTAMAENDGFKLHKKMMVAGEKGLTTLHSLQSKSLENTPSSTATEPELSVGTTQDVVQKESAMTDESRHNAFTPETTQGVLFENPASFDNDVNLDEFDKDPEDWNLEGKERSKNTTNSTTTQQSEEKPVLPSLNANQTGTIQELLVHEMRDILKREVLMEETNDIVAELLSLSPKLLEISNWSFPLYGEIKLQKDVRQTLRRFLKHKAEKEKYPKD